MRLSTLAAALTLPLAAAQGQVPARFTPEQIRAAVVDDIRAKVREGGGAYRLRDELTGEVLELEMEQVAMVSTEGLWRIHDPTRKVSPDARGYFACVNFHPRGGPPEKRYDIDIRVSTDGGKLAVAEVLIHRVPRLVDGKWTWEARFRKEKVEPAGGAR
ncbi:MAG TPA: hypothetical protein VLD85_08775 [Anaeromyxobacteraceae bacterium]|nr:hypothetical protein [Anaeromyxobacteraceae bacterium]